MSRWKWDRELKWHATRYSGWLSWTKCRHSAKQSKLGLANVGTKGVIERVIPAENRKKSAEWKVH